MSEALMKRFETAIQDPFIRDEITTLGFMVEVYCKGNHTDRPKSALESDAVDLGVYDGAHHIPQVCTECAAHLAYGEKRRALCPKDPKPSCKYCDIHCYSPEEAEFQRTVMRYSGPRAILKPFLFRPAIEHLLQERRDAKRIREMETDH